MLTILFIGTRGEFSLRPLQMLLSAHQVVGIVESVPREARSDRLPSAEWISATVAHWLGHPSLWSIARRYRIPYFQLTPRSVADFRILLEQLRPDVGCIASMNQLLPEGCINLPRFGFLNLHPSLLPKFRGPNVWFWHYHEMETEGGATIIRIDRGEDTGDILRQASFPIPIGLPPRELMRRAITLGTELLQAALGDLEKGSAKPVDQRDRPCPVRARYLTEDDALFDWQGWTLEQTFHFLQGVEPWYDGLTPQHGFLGNLDWRATRYERAPCPTPAGRIRLDWKGAYFAHPHGKIRLWPRHLLWRMVLLLALAVVAARL